MFFKSTKQVCNHLYLNLIKTALKTLIFFKKLIFALLNPKDREVIEDSSKTPLNFSALQYTYLGKNLFQYHQGLVRKKEIEKWLLRTSVQCISKLISKNSLSSHRCHFIKDYFFEPNSFMHMFYVSTLYRQHIKFLHQKL